MAKILLLVELRGGNDGLNMVVPYSDRNYYQLRPSLGIPRERVLQLDERMGFHERLEPLMAAWKANELAIIQGVGYPSPNRSHFRSIEIWDTASEAGKILSVGWIAQVFEGKKLPAGAGVDSIVLDTNVLPTIGPELRTIVMQDPESFLQQAQAAEALKGAYESSNPALKRIIAVSQQINGAATGLRDTLLTSPPLHHRYDEQYPLGRQLEVATRLVTSRLPVVAIKMALGGFDTHANQPHIHEKLLSFLARNLSVLRENLIAANVWNDVVIVTYSEFGRRARQNNSGGTDHGTAAPQIVMGGNVKGGFYGSQPSLVDLEDGDLKFSVDFRNVFSTLAMGCWGIQPEFRVQKKQALGFLR